ncbi:hypothetical protein GCM10022243_25610 [Saccharothrix violaceirubra]|uniref:Uncharacterized protein n=1 Tax=Saccharothrix violaceirubra TaxID=413306 RepID=A0A7W7WWX8_9PSEU|nr:hypothetical protein [Saccharothrix violaceirubra]MBB4966048.1 hypothetical protein [Saccharothrix violaceirubra]
MSEEPGLVSLSAVVVAAVIREDVPAFNEAAGSLGEVIDEADPAELDEAAALFAAAMPQVGPRGVVAGEILGTLVELGASPDLGPWVDRVSRAFEERWAEADRWGAGLLGPLQQERVRRAPFDRERLASAAEKAAEEVESAHWLVGLLAVLDDERLVVLHPVSGRGFEITIGGIADNFQLHTLLAATVIGDASSGLLLGTPPAPEWVAAATDADPHPEGMTAHGQFNLVDAHGEWIWNEGRPAAIPVFDGRRVVVLEPLPYERSWNAGRIYPDMVPTVRLDRVLPEDEATRWLSAVRPEQR